ncbi:hypothetical protein TgHK011_003328 [Trichoderma gracile]|nr:hypothetical protein TgHK011_003328 [Trichoderma gracile]
MHCCQLPPALHSSLPGTSAATKRDNINRSHAICSALPVDDVINPSLSSLALCGLFVEAVLCPIPQRSVYFVRSELREASVCVGASPLESVGTTNVARNVNTSSSAFNWGLRYIHLEYTPEVRPSALGTWPDLIRLQ